MSYTRPQTFVPGTFWRTCDLCGIRYRSNQLSRGEDGFYRCMQYCKEVPPITRDRISAASQRRKEAPPPKWGLPFDQKYTYPEEVEVFNFLVNSTFHDSGSAGGIRQGAAPSQTFNITGDGFVVANQGTQGWNFAAINETIRYCYDLIVEGKRPATWISGARRKLVEMADLLVSTQTVSGTADTNVLFGGFDVNTLIGPGFLSVYRANEGAGNGYALVRAYQITGDKRYLTSARNTAHFMRALQWSSRWSDHPTSADAAGTIPYYAGAHSQLLNKAASGPDTGKYIFDSVYRPDTSLPCTEFLNLLLSVDGDAFYGGLGNDGTQSFSATGSILLSTMVADGLSFWKNGATDNFSGTVITGLSSTSPRELYNAFPSNKSILFSAGTGNWEYVGGGNAATGTTITGNNFAQGLRALLSVSGFNTQVSDVWKWLMSFSSNPAFTGAAGLTRRDFPIAGTTLSANQPVPSGQGNVIPPSYNPKLALASTLIVRDSANGLAPIAINSTGFYAWASTGLMAGIQSLQDASSFRKAKDAATQRRFRIPIDFSTTFSANLTGGSVLTSMGILHSFYGLDMQSSPITINSSPAAVAQAAAVFRYAPQGFVSTGRPDNTQPGSGPGTMQVQS